MKVIGSILLTAIITCSATLPVQAGQLHEQLQNDLDQWIDHYNNERSHQGKICKGRTPMQTLEDGKAIWKEKFID